MTLGLLEAQVHNEGMNESVRIRMADYGKFFATRARAREIWAEVEKIHPYQSVILEWHGVAGMSGAFASEFAGLFMKTSRRIGDIGMNEDVRETYELAIRRWEAAQVEPGPVAT